MRGFNSLPLDDDIIDRIFFFLPDFSALATLRLTCKALNNVYVTHPNSIIRAICYNITGPALPQALRLARYQIDAPPPADIDENISNLATPIFSVTPAEITILIEDAEVVRELEWLFSMMFKDRTSSGKLSSMESWRFRRAMYRMMLYSTIFSGEDIQDTLNERYDDLFDEAAVQEDRDKRKNFLLAMNTFDLYELYSISEFMMAAVRWLGVGDIIDEDEEELYDLALARGPYQLYEAYQRNELDLDELRDVINEYGLFETPNLLEGYLSQALEMVWEEREARPPAEDNTHWLSILEALPDPKDSCRMCHKECGHLNLWSEGSWRMLACMPFASVEDLPALVPGQLMSNIVDGPIFEMAFASLEDDLDIIKVLREIHELRTTPYENWNKEDLLCEECIIEILRFHIHLWLLERKRKSLPEGDAIPHENCWYGWNCYSQVRKIEHAKRLNHACPPSK